MSHKHKNNKDLKYRVDGVQRKHTSLNLSLHSLRYLNSWKTTKNKPVGASEVIELLVTFAEAYKLERVINK